jgi:hypothetical protein
MDIPFRWWDSDGVVRVTMGIDDDPDSFGCREMARGFPYCEATVDTPAKGYKTLFAWVAMAHPIRDGQEGFEFDVLPPLKPRSDPFGYLAYKPTFFDGPHADVEDVEFRAHTFLCGFAGEILYLRKEARAILGFSWGYSKRGREVVPIYPALLSPQDWDSHREYLERRFPDWSFRPGFSQHPLEP